MLLSEGRMGGSVWEGFVPPSSRGLGYRPFKAVTRIRIPLGAPATVVVREDDFI